MMFCPHKYKNNLVKLYNYVRLKLTIQFMFTAQSANAHQQSPVTWVILSNPQIIQKGKSLFSVLRVNDT